MPIWPPFLLPSKCLELPWWSVLPENCPWDGFRNIRCWLGLTRVALDPALFWPVEPGSVSACPLFAPLFTVKLLAAIAAACYSLCYLAKISSSSVAFARPSWEPLSSGLCFSKFFFYLMRLRSRLRERLLSVFWLSVSLTAFNICYYLLNCSFLDVVLFTFLFIWLAFLAIKMFTGYCY